MIKHRTKSISASFLVSAYTLAPLLTHAVYAEEYDPFDGCNPSETTCTVKPPEFSLSAIAHFGDYIMNYVLYIIVSIVNIMSSVGVDLFERTGGTNTVVPGVGMITTGWKYGVVGDFINFFNAVSMTMFAIGTFIAFAEAAVAYSNGQGNFAGTFVNVIKAFVFALLFTLAFVEVFRTVIELTPKIMANSSDPNGEVLSRNIGTVVVLIATVIANAGLISLPGAIAIVAFMAVAVYKFALMLAKRYVMFFVLLAEGAVLPFTMARGYAGNFQSYIQKVLMFLLGCLLQVWLFGMGFSFFDKAFSTLGDTVNSLSYMVSMFVVGMAFVGTGDKVYSLLGTIGSDGTKPLSEAMHAAGNVYRTAHMTCMHKDIHASNEGSGNVTGAIISSGDEGGK